MNKLKLICCFLVLFNIGQAQNYKERGDSLKANGLLVPALMQYGQLMAEEPTPENAYEIAKTSALLWTSDLRDTAFYFLDYALAENNSLTALYEPEFLSLIDDPRWLVIEDQELKKFIQTNGPIKNQAFARALFRMIIKDQGFMYAGNIERGKYMKNGGYFSSPTIFPILAMEEKMKKENNELLFQLIDQYGWPTASDVTEFAAAGAALIINHTDHETRVKYYPLLEKAFKAGEAQPLRYAKMSDRLLVEVGKEQLYGTQWKFQKGKKVPHPIKNPENVDQRRAEIGLGPLQNYLKERFNIIWHVEQEKKE